MRPKREVNTAKAAAVQARGHLCRFPSCHRLGDYARGLCAPCYRGMKKYVDEGVIAIEVLEQRGKVAQKRMTLKEWLLS